MIDGINWRLKHAEALVSMKNRAWGKVKNGESYGNSETVLKSRDLSYWYSGRHFLNLQRSRKLINNNNGKLPKSRGRYEYPDTQN
jgi:hypothetical protein